jgi:hypothetical protein
VGAGDEALDIEPGKRRITLHCWSVSGTFSQTW